MPMEYIAPSLRIIVFTNMENKNIMEEILEQSRSIRRSIPSRISPTSIESPGKGMA